jgi:hypothetical protein
MRFSLQGGLSGALAAGFGFVLAIEGAVLHLWVAQRSATWAWVVTALNIATVIWLWREYRATRQARATVSDTDVEIDAGSRLRVRIPLNTIASVEAATWRSVPDMASDFANIAKPLEPNIVIVLREPVSATIALGVKKRISRIGLCVDDADAFRALTGFSSPQIRS